jgi:hypothetical protein
MDANLNNSGKTDSASTLTALQSLKHVTCSTPRQLTESEIKLLRQSKVEIAKRVNELLELNKAKKD